MSLNGIIEYLNQIKTKLIDLETGVEIVDPSAPGELLISGATVFDGYYESPLGQQRSV